MHADFEEGWEQIGLAAIDNLERSVLEIRAYTQQKMNCLELGRQGDTEIDTETP
jgi:hypothetical protein